MSINAEIGGLSRSDVEEILQNIAMKSPREVKNALASPHVHDIFYQKWLNYSKEHNIAHPTIGSSQEEVRDYISRMKRFVFDNLNLSDNHLRDAEMRELAENVVRKLDDAIRGLGILQPFYTDPEVEEIVYRNGNVLIEKNGQLRVVMRATTEEERNSRNQQLLIYVRNLGSARNVEMSKSKPYGVFEVPPRNDRLAAVISPLYYREPSQTIESLGLNLRKYHELTLSDLQKFGTFWDYNTLLLRKGLKPAVPGKPDYYFRGFMRYIASHDVFGEYIERPGTFAPLEDGGGDFFNRMSDIAAQLLAQFLFFLPGYSIDMKDFRAKTDAPANPEYMITAMPDGRDKEMFLDVVRHNGWGVALALAYFVYLNMGSFIVSGEFSSGKTTLLNSFTPFIRQDMSPVVIEEYYELQMRHPYALRLVTGSGENAFNAAEVLNQVMTRFRPDLIILSELVSGAQTREFLTAANLGKRVAGTTHANSARVAPLRLETLGQSVDMKPIEVRLRFATGISLIVHQGRDPATGARFVSEIVGVGDELDERENLVFIPIYSSGRIHKASEAAPPLLRHLIGVGTLLIKHGNKIGVLDEDNEDAINPAALAHILRNSLISAERQKKTPFEFLGEQTEYLFFEKKEKEELLKKGSEEG